MLHLSNNLKEKKKKKKRNINIDLAILPSYDISESEEDKIPEEIRVKDGETLRTLGSYMGNKVNQIT